MSNPHAAIHAEDSKDLRVVAVVAAKVLSGASEASALALLFPHVSSSVFNTKRKLDKLLRENIRSTVTKI